MGQPHIFAKREVCFEMWLPPPSQTFSIPFFVIFLARSLARSTSPGSNSMPVSQAPRIYASWCKCNPKEFQTVRATAIAIAKYSNIEIANRSFKSRDDDDDDHFFLLLTLCRSQHFVILVTVPYIFVYK